MSIRETAAAIGMSYSGTRERLQKLGRLRSKSEGRTRFPRRPFSGDAGEKAYLTGLRAGDINAWKKSPNTIEVRVSTTHPAMSKLFSRAFMKYGHLMLFAERAYLPGHFRWQSKAHLDRSFDFLVPKTTRVPSRIGDFYRFLGGYSDAEGCWCIYPNAARVKVSWMVETLDSQLIRRIYERLRANGLHPLLYRKNQSGSIKKNQEANKGKTVKFRLVLNRSDEVVALAKRLKLYSLHPEKIAKMQLIIDHPRGKWSEIATKVRKLKLRIKAEVMKYEGEAERAYNTRLEALSQGVVG